MQDHQKKRKSDGDLRKRQTQAKTGLKTMPSTLAAELIRVIP
jgi:hypothetical protein